MDETPILEARGLHHHFPAGGKSLHVLRGLSLTLAQGSFAAIMGSSGAGKSTLLYILGLLLRPSRGELFFGGSRLAGLPDNRLSAIRGDHIGFVFQDYNLIPGLTLLENVETGLAYTRLPPDGWTALCRGAIEAVGLTGKEGSYPSQLSGGEAQRAAIARVTVKSPSLVLADEPTGSLDGEAEERVLELLRGLADAGRAVVLVTHDERVAARADRVLRLEQGMLREGHPLVR